LALSSDAVGEEEEEGGGGGAVSESVDCGFCSTLLSSLAVCSAGVS